MSVLAHASTERERRTANPEVSVRAAESADQEFVLSLVPRLVASGLPPWRDPRKMLAAYVEVIGSILHAPRSGAALLIAEDSHGTPLGFILLVAATDSYTHERHGHVAQIVVVESQQELAVARALIAAAEEWSCSRGYRLLTLSEFWANHPARAVYGQLGFVEEIVKYRKTVR
jgi:GNAT superfamily N-acetyltransferase